MKSVNVDIGSKTLVFHADDFQLRHAVLPFLVAVLGEPDYISPTDGDVGEPRREIVVEPVPISTPVPETTPVVTPSKEPVPA